MVEWGTPQVERLLRVSGGRATAPVAIPSTDSKSIRDDAEDITHYVHVTLQKNGR